MSQGQLRGLLINNYEKFIKKKNFKAALSLRFLF